MPTGSRRRRPPRAGGARRPQTAGRRRPPTARGRRLVPPIAALVCLAALGLAPASPPAFAAPRPAAGTAATAPSVAPRLEAPAADSLGVDSEAVAIEPEEADSLGADSLAGAPAPDYVARVRAGFTPAARAYDSTRTLLDFVEPLYAILAGLLVLFSGLAAKMRDIAHHMGHRRYVRVLVYLFLYAIVGFVLGFPLAWYRDFALEHQYGLSTQAFGGWLGDQLRGEMAVFVFLGGFGIVALAYRAIERRPRHWWLVLGTASLPLVLAVALLSPLVFDPLFNRFEPLQDAALEQRIVALAEKAGIPGRRVFEVNKSAQTRKLNAYVSGFGPSQRIVLWDTTLREARDDEILFIMGHEMGHYALGHEWKGILFFTVLAFAVFFLAQRIIGWAIRRFGDLWGFHHAHDVASLPLFGVTLTLLLFLAQPAINGFGRHIEHEADVFGLEVTHLNDAAARAFIKLGQFNKADPEPPKWIAWFLYSHPPLIERIRFAERYHPWTEGRPNRLFHPRK